MQILNAKQAFEIMSAGQAVLCRAIGDLLDFDILENFPATVFFGDKYEFRLAPRFITIGSQAIEVPEPVLSLSELKKSASYYGPNILCVDRPNEVLNCIENEPYLSKIIAMRLLHATPENAIAHAKALITLNGGSLDVVEVTAPSNLDGCTPLEEGIKTPELIKQSEPAEEPPKKRRAKKEAFTVDEVPAVETNLDRLVANFTAQINECESVDAVLSVRSTFACNSHLARHHIQHLCMLVEEKNAELDPDAYTPQAETIEDNLLEFKAKPVINEDALYEERLKELLEKVDEAQTPKDVVALTHEVKSWSTEKRTPLITAINNRLIALGQQKEKPSLMIQIQNAKDLTELDALEIDVAECDLAIQKKLLDCVEQRCIELGE